MGTLLRQIEAANVDAIIVQDLGVAQLLQYHQQQTINHSNNKRNHVAIHASTQQSVTNALCV